MHIDEGFAPDGRSVSHARRFVREALEKWGAGDLVEEAVLAVSELVTNAVVHAGTPVRVGLDLDPRGLLLQVQDLHPHRALPVGLQPPADDAEHGRGLLISSALATSWGVDYSAGEKRVWLRLERGGTRPDAPAPLVPVRVSTDPAPLGVAVVEVSADGTVAAWNDEATRMFGWSSADVLGRPWEDLVEPSDRRAWAGDRPDVGTRSVRRWQGTCVVRREDGRVVEAFGSRGPATGGGLVVLLVPLAHRALLEWPPPDVRPATESADPLGLREDALSRLGVRAYLDLVVERCRDTLSARAAYLLLGRDLDGDFEVATVSGLDDALRGTRISPGSPGTPDARHARLPMVLSDLGAVEAGWLGAAGLRSLLVVPVVMEDRVIGALGVGSERVAGFDDEQGAVLQRVANAVAAAAERARLRVSERERRAWLAFLAESTDLLAGSLDQDMTMAITGQIVVPQLAAWCAVYLHDDRARPVLHQVWHRDEQESAPLRELLERLGPDRVIASTDVSLPGAVHTIALLARGREIGALTLGRAAGDRLEGEALVVAESVARRAALAIDNARAHGELRAVGETLQRSLLPASIPSTPSFDVGVVYEAAGERSLVGGDFYDLFPIHGGDWCFAVGDVCGTGAEAAAVTGLARHTIRALALAGFPVAPTLERLNDAILEEGERSRFLTLVCGTLHPLEDGRLRVSLVSAGHPLPFVVRRDGTVGQLGRPQALLGVLDRVAFVSDDHVLERGDLLVAVTDGVLERRDGTRMLEEGGLMAELAKVGDLPAQVVAERIRRLVAEFTEEPQADDMAVLAIRVAPGR